MSNVNWTSAQLDAINARDGSVLVSAAAGSGKTAVLVRRIIESITDPVNPVSIDRMLIVTFTRLASSEMRSRIESAINELLRADPYNKYLLNQRRLLYSARISTIDSFCIDFVRQYFFELGVRGDFRVADKAETEILTQKAIDSAMEYFYKQNDKSFLKLVDCLCTYRDDKNLREHIKNTYKFLTALPFADEWLDNMLALYDTDKTPFEESPYRAYIISHAEDCVKYCRELIDTCFACLEADDFLDEKNIDKIRTVLCSDRAVIDSVGSALEDGDWDVIRAALGNIAFERFPSIRGADADINRTLIKNARDIYKPELLKLPELFFRSSADIKAETDRLYPVMKAFVACIRKFNEDYTALKSERNILEFSDIEHLMIRLLCKNSGGEIEFTDCAREISAMFDCVMVDEFQDINETQDLLFRAICLDRNNLFVVGDVKQSIYGFRQAKPEIFVGYKDRYPRYSGDNPDYPAKIILDRNFRSRKGITEACNFVFSTLMSSEVGGLEYGDEDRLVCGASYPESEAPTTELMLIDASVLDDSKNETALTLEAEKVAEKIFNLIYVEKMQITSGGTTRPLTFGDIAVLLRSAKGKAKKAVHYTEVFKRCGIPTVSDEKKKFFDENEIKVMLNLLRVIDNPLRDIPVLSAMMSPLFSFTPDEMAEIRAKYRRMPVYTAVKSFSAENKKCADFIAFIEKMRTLAVTTPVDRLISSIITLTGFDAVCEALNIFSGDNLLLLRDYAARYSESGYKTLTSFISYIDRMKDSEYSPDSSGASVDSDINAVRVLSIHASKGLEFPVCFICNTSAAFFNRDTGSDLILDNDNGFSIRYTEELRRHDTVQRKAMSLMLRDRKLSEEMRILYVAMTRAKERLIITSAQKNPQKYIMNIESSITSCPLPPFAVRSFGSFSDWLFACAVLHPSLGELRTAVEPAPLPQSALPWKFEIVKKDDSLYDESSQPDVKPDLIPESEPDREFLEKFRRTLDFEYAFKPLQTLPQKVSASALAHRDNKIFNKILRKPQFIDDKPSDGAERGTAFHTLMERCSLSAARADSREEAQRLCNEGFISSRQLELLDFEKIDSFMSGELMSRVLKSTEVFREYTFTVRLKASQYDPDLGNTCDCGSVIMQGAVDLIFIEDGEAVIVDYKTDRVGEAVKLSDMYRRQLELYRSAVEETMNVKVKQLLIHSVHLNETVEV